MHYDQINRRALIRALTATMAGAALPTDLFSTDEKIQDPGKAIFVKAKGGKHGKIADGDIAFKFASKQTGGHIGITEGTLPVGYMGAPPHLHKGFDEICRVTQGTLTIMVGDELFEVNAGDWHLRPKGIVHSFWNTGKETAKFIELYSPAGHEAYMNALADLFSGGGRPKPGDLEKLAQRFDIIFDWPKLKTITEKYKVRL